MAPCGKRILYISYFFPPTGGGGVQRPLKTVKYLNALGWSIDVLTTLNARYDVYDHSLIQEIPPSSDHFKVLRVAPGKMRHRIYPEASTKRTNTKIKNRPYLKWIFNVIFELIHFLPDKHFLWSSRADKVIRAHYSRENTKPDVILSTAMPISCHFLARKLANHYDVPWVAEYRDLWNDTHYHRRLLPTKTWYDIYNEKRILKNADHVIVVVPRFKRILSTQIPGLNESISVIPNGYDVCDFSAFPDTRPKNKHFTVVYTGRVYENRDISPLLSALKIGISRKIWSEDNINIHFYGPRLPKKYEDSIKSLSLDRMVSHKGYVSHNESIKALYTADCLLLIESSPSAFTGKVWEYMASKKPILSILPENSDLICELNSYGASEVCTFDETIVFERLKKMFNMWSTDCLRYTVNDCYLKEKTREYLTKDISQILIKALSKSS